MHSNDEHLLVVGPIEDPDPSAFRKPTRRAPEEVMLQLLGARLFETEDFTALWIDSGHDMPDGPVLTGSVHPLKDQQQRIPVGCIVEALQRTQLRNVFTQELLILLLRRADRLHARRPLVEFDLVSGPDPEVF